jgi:hypothetical protein
LDDRDRLQVIIDIAPVLKSRIWNSAGYFSMKGYRFNEYWIEGWADLHEQFWMFLKFADGTKVSEQRTLANSVNGQLM